MKRRYKILIEVASSSSSRSAFISKDVGLSTPSSLCTR